MSNARQEKKEAWSFELIEDYDASTVFQKLDQDNLLELAVWEVIRQSGGDLAFLVKFSKEEKQESVKNQKHILSTLISDVIEKLPQDSDKQRKLTNAFHRVNDPAVSTPETLREITKSVINIAKEPRGNALWRSLYSMFCNPNSTTVIKEIFDDNGKLMPKVLGK